MTRIVPGTLVWCQRRLISFNASQKNKYLKYYRTLELEDGASQDLVRRQYIHLVKKYHPDSNPDTQAMHKFHEIDEAYKKLQEKFQEDKRVDEGCIGEYGLYYEAKQGDEEETYQHPDIRHTAPQHRQYLSNEGFGYGNIYQRQRQYRNMRVIRAADNVHNHQVSKLTAAYESRIVDQSNERAKKNKATNAMERMVEDLILEAMAKGDWDNLKGAGKPLPDKTVYNPYQDFVSHKVNEILVDQGFAPEWIMLKKEIQDDANKIRDLLKKKRATLGPIPLNEEEVIKWRQFCSELEKKEVKALNKCIDKFNLVVPIMTSQTFHFHLDRESDLILQKGLAKDQQRTTRTNSDPNQEDSRVNKSILIMFREKFRAYFSSSS